MTNGDCIEDPLAGAWTDRARTIIEADTLRYPAVGVDTGPMRSAPAATPVSGLSSRFVPPLDQMWPNPNKKRASARTTPIVGNEPAIEEVTIVPVPSRG
jgi:hypothetical protein